MNVTILWQENGIFCNKSFGKLKYSLYTKEHLKIPSFQQENLNLLINSNSELHGACRHKPKFHRYAKTTPLSVLMTNNSSERVPDLNRTPPPILNISNTTCTYVENEPPTDELSQLAIQDIHENSEETELNHAEV